MRRGLALVLLVGCTRGGGTSDAAAPVEAGADAAVVVLVEAGAPEAKKAAERSIDGEWERTTEPYKGMRMRITRTASTLDAAVTVLPPVTDERIADAKVKPAVAKAQLECQQRLWKVGEPTMFDVHARGNAFEGTYLVRDWGLTSGVCRHADSRAPARLTVDADDLEIAVTRKGTVTQRWSRVH